MLAEPARAFEDALGRHGIGPLRRAVATTLQVNVGRRCNQACHHCHVDAGPTRTEALGAEVAARVLALLRASPAIEVVDLTGGAPELNPQFRRLVRAARELGRRVIDRCNLTILLEPGMEDLGAFLAAKRVEIVASLPCYESAALERQRGRGVFDRSIEALRRLNALGYGRSAAGLRLTLVHNPVGARLPPDERALEARYCAELDRRFGIRFDRLVAITNMPIKRFASFLERTGALESYMSLLVNHFEPANVPELMCRRLVNVAWDGTLHDCDFNQMLGLDLGAGAELHARTVWDVETLGVLTGRPIATGRHCFGCTAGAGSSCGGALGRPAGGALASAERLAGSGAAALVG